MDGARFAALSAVALAGFAMMINFLALPMLMTKVARIHVDMQNGMKTFKKMADHAWDEMMDIRRIQGYPAQREPRDVEYDTNGANGAPFSMGYPPQPSDSGSVDYQQQPWDQLGISVSTTRPVSIVTQYAVDGSTTISQSVPNDNGCPAGPPGPPGESGKDGLDGAAGPDGLAGQDAKEMKFEDLDMCSICPGGPRGQPGQIGLPGKNGTKGVMGEIGKPGVNGTVGLPGLPGKRGFEGLPGKPGGKGKPGKPASGGKGRPGPKGATGPIGRAGPQGPPGNASMLNNGTGPPGPRGVAGLNGIPGKTGQPGPRGITGFAGDDAGWCPCPKPGGSSGNGASTVPAASTTLAPPVTNGLGAIPQSNVITPFTLTPPAPYQATVASPVGNIESQEVSTQAPALAPAPSVQQEGAFSPPVPLAESTPTPVVSFGGEAPSFGPPASSAIISNGGGIVALPPASGAAPAPPAIVSQQPVGDIPPPQATGPNGDGTGGTVNLAQVPFQ